VATKKKKQAQAKARAQHRQQKAKQKEKARAEHHTHLPKAGTKAGTKADDDYLLRRSREDLVDFGVNESHRRGTVNWVIVVAVLALFVVGAVGLLILTTR
jgi:sRNA-binding protein